MDTVSKFHAEAPQPNASEGLAEGPYVAARAGFEPATLRTKGVQSTNEPQRPSNIDKLSTISLTGSSIGGREDGSGENSYWSVGFGRASDLLRLQRKPCLS